MRRHAPLVVVCGALALFASTAPGRQNGSAAAANAQAQVADNTIHLDVVAETKSGPAISGLQPPDFTVLDNSAPQPLTAFSPRSGRDGHVEVVLVLDDVNAEITVVEEARRQVDKFLRLEAGALAHPMAIAILTDKGLEPLGGFSTDGNDLSARLSKAAIPPRSLGRSSGVQGNAEIFQLSIRAFEQIAMGEGTRPGRKMLLWISPGWPMLVGPHVDLNTKQQQEIFNEIVRLNTEMLRARLTLYSLDPSGLNDVGLHSTYYKSFLKAVSKPTEVNAADLALQVLAVQSGGLALTTENDLASQIRRCLTDADNYYELAIDPKPAAQPNEYHSLVVKIAKGDATGRTRMGYYTQP